MTSDWQGIEGKMTDKRLTAAMQNTLAYRLGQAHLKAGAESRAKAGDLIDAGLILCRVLDEAGFGLVLLPSPPEPKERE